MYRFSYVGLLIFLFICVSCSCIEEQKDSPLDIPNNFRVTAFEIDAQNLFITFNQSVDTETVEAANSLILTPPAVLAGTDYYQIEFWDLNNTFLIVEFGFFEACSDAFQNGDNCPIEFKMISDKDVPLSVRSADGQLLDGNRDGSDGGDYVRDFTW